MTTRTSAVAAGCVGEGCDTPRSWPLHHIRHRGVFRRLCTSCVLKCFPGDFCTSCFALLDGFYPSPSGSGAGSRSAVVHCSKCPSVSHLACLTNPGVPVQFVCPICRNPEGFSYFSVCSGSGDERQRPAIDVDSAKVLLAAARLAASSMFNAAAAARVEAERKMLEAMMARKRANDLLEKAILISKSERKRKKSNGSDAKALTLTPEAINQDKKRKKKKKKKKKMKLNGSDAKALALTPKATNEDKKKKRKLNGSDAKALVLTPEVTNQDKKKKRNGSDAKATPETTNLDKKKKKVKLNGAMDAKLKGASVTMQSNVVMENKDSRSTKLNLPENAKHEDKEKKGLRFSSQTESNTRIVSKGMQNLAVVVLENSVITSSLYPKGVHHICSANEGSKCMWSGSRNGQSQSGNLYDGVSFVVFSRQGKVPSDV